MTEDIGTFKSGTGKVISVGDDIKVTGQGRFRVTKVFEQGGQHFVDAYGGKPGRLLTRTFNVDKCTRLNKAKDDPNFHHREAIADVSARSKSKRKGWA